MEYKSISFGYHKENPESDMKTNHNFFLSYFSTNIVYFPLFILLGLNLCEKNQLLKTVTVYHSNFQLVRLSGN